MTEAALELTLNVDPVGLIIGLIFIICGIFVLITA